MLQPDRVTAEVLRDDDALERVGGQWRDLHARCADPTPFQAHAWLTAWWRAYGRPGALRVALVHDGDRLVAAAALVVRRCRGIRVLEPVGAGISDITDVLVDASCADAALDGLVAALRAQPGWDVLELPEVRPGSAADGLLARWGGPQWALPSSTCLLLPAASVEDLLRRAPTRTAATVRKKLRRIAASGVVARPAVGADVPGAINDLLRLHAAQWAGRGVNPEHLRPRFRAHLQDALVPMVAAGQAVVLLFERDGRVVAVDVVLLAGRMAGDYLYGVDPQLRESVDTYTLLLRAALAEAIARGAIVFDQLRGREPHKQRLRPDVVEHRRLLLAAPGRPAARVHAGVATARARTAALVRDRPELRAAIDRVRDTVAGWRAGRGGAMTGLRR